MPLTNPWLATPAPPRELERPDLEERILNLLSTHNLAVSATIKQRVDWFWTATTWRGEPGILEPAKCSGLDWFGLDARRSLKDLPGHGPADPSNSRV